MAARAEGEGGEAARERVGDFASWAHHYHDYYAEGGRIDREYRVSRLMIMSSRSWITHIDNRLRAVTGLSRARW